MPPAAVVGAAVAGAIAGTTALVVGTVATVTGALLIAGGTFVATLLSSQLNRPDSNFNVETRERRATIRGTNQKKVLGFGTVSLGGHVELFEASGSQNQFLHIIESHFAHPSFDILDWIIDGERVGDLDGSGFATGGRFAGKVRLRKLLGAFDQAADAETVAETSSWTEAHKGGGITGTAARFEFDQNAFPQGFRNLVAIVRAQLVYDPREPEVAILTSNTSGVFVCSAPHGFSIGQQVWIIGHTGAVVTGPAGSEAWRGQWHQIKTIGAADIFTLIDEDGNDVTFSAGGTGGVASAMVWSNNWALCLRAFMCNRHTYHYRDEEIASVIAAANTSDEQVALNETSADFTAAGGSQWLGMAERGRWRTGDVVQVSTTDTPPAGLAVATDYFIGISDRGDRVTLSTTLEDARAGVHIVPTDAGAGTHTLTRFSQLRYTVDGFVSLGQDPGQALEDFKAAGAGIVTELNGLLHILPGVARTSTGSITESDFAEDIEAIPGVPHEHAFNAVRNSFADPDNNFEVLPAPIYANDLYRIEDNGDLVVFDPVLAFTNSPEGAHRLAKIMVERQRQEITIATVLKPHMLESTVWDVKPLTVGHWGFAAKEFRIASIQEREDLGLIVGMQEEAAAVWDYDLGAQVNHDLAPNTILPDPWGTVTPPQGLIITSGTADLFVRQDGTVFSRIRVVWTLSDDVYVVQGGRVHIEAKPSASSEWELHQSTDGEDTLLYVLDVEDGVSYDVRAKFVRQNLVESAWTQAPAHIVQGKSVPPLKPDTFTFSRNADGTRRFDWTQAVVEADVRTGGGYLIRSFLGTTSDWDAMSELHTGVLKASPYETNQLAAGVYTFAIKTIDGSGNPSADALFIQATLGNPRLENVLVERNDHLLGWPGVLTDCYKDTDNILKAVADTGEDWDSLGTWDSLGAWETITGRVTPILYETETIDLGLDVNFTPLVTAEGTGLFTFEMQTGTDAQGSPQAPWVALADVTGARYIKIRCTVADATLPTLSALTTLLDSENREDEFLDVNTATESATWFNSIAAGHFQIGSKSGEIAAISVARIEALQNVGAGWTWELISKAVTVNGEPGAEFKVYNNAGTLADATIDAILRGPKK